MSVEEKCRRWRDGKEGEKKSRIREKRLNFCGNVQSLLHFGVYGWSVILVSLRRSLRDNNWFGIRLGIWLLFGVKHMVFLRGFP